MTGAPKDFSLQAAMTSSLYDQASLPEFTCEGTKCEYPSFASLGVSSTCEDITAHTTVICGSTFWCGDGHVTPSTSACNDSTRISDWHSRCELLPDSKHSLVIGAVYPRVAQTRLTITHGDWWLPRTGSDGPLHEPARFYDVYIAHVPHKGAGDTLEDFAASWMNGLQIFHCGFELSAIEYHDWLKINGTLIPGDRTPYTLLLAETPDEPLWSLRLEASDPSFKHNRTFILRAIDYDNLLADLAHIFEPQGYPELISTPIYLSNDIPATITNLTNAISDRMLSGPNATRVIGQAYSEQVFFKVQWPWIALPATLVLGACGFLAAVMFLTHKGDQLIWKSSLTPLLMTDVSYPLSMAHQRPLWTDSQRKDRVAVIANHLTK